MKLCHIVPSLEEIQGGPSKSVRALCVALGRAGHEVELLTTHADASPAGDLHHEGNLTIRAFRRDTPARLCPSSGLRAAARATTADAVHNHGLWLRTLHYAKCSAARNHAPLIISPRGMMSHWAWHHRPWRKRFARMLVHPGALRAATAWHVTSTEEEQEIRDLGFAQPICVSANGVSAPSEEDITKAVRYWREACPETATRRVALFYSRFHTKKRVIELIDSWLEHGPRDWLLLLVGIPQQYTPETLESYAAKMGGSDRVRAFSGVGLPAPYPIASLFVLPSHNENFGLAIAEALACGVPALVTDTTPWSQLNETGNGWCVPWARFGPALAMATAESVETLRERGIRAQAWTLREYSWDRAVIPLSAFYAGLKQPTA